MFNRIRWTYRWSAVSASWNKDLYLSILIIIPAISPARSGHLRPMSFREVCEYSWFNSGIQCLHIFDIFGHYLYQFARYLHPMSWWTCSLDNFLTCMKSWRESRELVSKSTYLFRCILRSAEIVVARFRHSSDDLDKRQDTTHNAKDLRHRK